MTGRMESLTGPAARRVVAAATIAAMVALPNLGAARLWDRDEPRNAGAAREMMQSGDWITPTFNGELRAHKPALLYWCMIGAYQAFGVNEFSARLPSAVAAIVTTALACALGARLFGGTAGLLGAVALATSLSYVVVARAATPDAVLIACFTAAMYAFARGVPWRGREAGAVLRPEDVPWSTYATAYAAMGVAVLAKGLIGFVLPTAVIGLFFLYAGRKPREQDAELRRNWAAVVEDWLAPLSPLNIWRTAWKMHPLLLAGLVLAIAGPWYLTVDMRTGGEFLSGFIGGHHVGRFTSAMEGHGGPPFYYLVAICIGFFPWSAFLGPMLYDSYTQGRANDPARLSRLFLGCWAGVVIVFFSIAATKLPSYVLPSYPALALLTGAYLDRMASGQLQLRPFWMRGSFATAALAGLGVIVGAGVAFRIMLPSEVVVAASGAAILGGAVVAAVLWEWKRTSQALAVYSAGAVALALALLAWAPERLDRYANAELLREAASLRQDDSAPMATLRVFEPSWAFYVGRRIEPYEDVGAAEAFLREQPNGLLATTAPQWEAMRDRLPPDVDVVLRQQRFLRDHELVVLGRTGVATAQRPDRAPDPLTR